MPILRQHIKEFAATWNQHPIRKQPRRPTSIPGKPYMNYHYPNINRQRKGYRTTQSKRSQVLDYRCDFDTGLLELLEQTPLDPNHINWDLNEYLPSDTLSWCHLKLSEVEFNPQDPPLIEPDNYHQPYLTVYLYLREQAHVHWNSGDLPILQLCEAPVLARN
ncbi:MAG: hypothetical protein ACRD8Z_07540 [Nitrososphaeraceae archaeon]